MKLLLHGFRERYMSYGRLWKESPTLDVQENPDLSSDDLGENSHPLGAANSITVETENYAERVKEAVKGHSIDAGLADERGRHKRTPGNPMGIFLGAQFERQWINPFFWLDVTLFSKSSILKNIANAKPQIRDMMGKSKLLLTGVKSALYNKTQSATLAAISNGKNRNIEKASLDTFELLGPAIEQLFDQISNDVRLDEGLGETALASREKIKKITDISLGREKRHGKMLKVIKENIESAKKEVQANMARAKEHLTRQKDNVVNALEAYQMGMRTRNDSVAEEAFWKFIQKAMKSPDSFLSGSLFETISLRRVFGTKNRVRILDALQEKFSGQVIGLEQSQQLTLDQDALLHNMDHRNVVVQVSLDHTDYKDLYRNLELEHVQAYKTDDADKPENDAAVLDILMTGLRRLGIDARSEIFQDAPIGLTQTERLVFILQYVENNVHILKDKNCSLLFKRVLYTWLQEIQASEAEQLAQGSHAEDGTPAQRQYVLQNAIVVRDAAHKAIDAFHNIDAALRDTNPDQINEKLQSMATFVSSFESFFGADGESGSLIPMIKNMPRDEQDLIHGMVDFKSLSSQIKTVITSLQEQRKTYVDEVLKNLPPSLELLETERERAQNIADRLKEMVGSGNGSGMNFSKEDFASLEAARSEIFERVKKWDDAQQDLANRHFDLPGTEEGFSGMKTIGRGLQGALDDIPVRDDLEDGAAHHDFNTLVQQRLREKVQQEREEQFELTLKANMNHQMNSLLSRSKDENGDIVVQHMPVPGTKLDFLEMADVTNTDGKLVFPESLNHREVLKDLTLARSGVHSENEKAIRADMVFHNKTHVVLLHEKQGQVVAESWKKPKRFFRNHNEVVRVPQTQPDARYRVLNFSTAGTKASTFAAGTRRPIRIAA